MTVLITGSCEWFVGDYIARDLVTAGERVVMFDPNYGANSPGPIRQTLGDEVATAHGDITSCSSIGDALYRNKVDQIVHLASLNGPASNADPYLATRFNLMGTANVLEMARLLGVRRVLLASSQVVFGADSQHLPESLPLTDDSRQFIADGIAIYAAGKAYLERLARQYSTLFALEAGGLRLSVMYGLGRRPGGADPLMAVIERPALNQPISVTVGDWAVTLIHVEDVASQFVTLLHADRAVVAGRFYNCGGDACTVRELAATVTGILPKSDITVTSDGVRTLNGGPASVSDQGLQNATGYRRRFAPLSVGVRACINDIRTAAGLPLV